MTKDLGQAISEKTARIGVIGLGYVGLPLINAFVNSGFRTIGFDVDQNKVDTLRAGKSYIQHIESDLVKRWIDDEKFEPTSDMSRLSEPECLLICVPTPLSDSRDPDLSYVEGNGSGDWRGVAAGPIGRAGKHHVSHHHPQRDSSTVGAKWTDGREGLLFGVQPRTRRPGQSRLLGRRDSESRRGNRRGKLPAGTSVVRTGHCESHSR